MKILNALKWAAIGYGVWWVYKRLPSLPQPLDGSQNIFGNELPGNQSPWGEGF